MVPITVSNRFALRQAYLILTRKCNLSCSHCIRESSPYEIGYIDILLAKNAIIQVAQEKTNPTLMLSGGEPTLHPNFEEILSFSLEHCNQVVVNTNGLKISKLLAFKHLHHKPIIQISIDGNEDLHNSIRGKSTFQKTLKNITKLSESNFKVVISTTVTNGNIGLLSELDSILIGKNFYQWNIKRVVSSGRADNSDDVETDMWNQFVGTVINKFKNRERIKIHGMFSIASFLDRQVIQQSEELARHDSNCGTGRSKLYINFNGSVYPCACMENKTIGNVKLEKLKKIMMRLSIIDILPKKESICFQCNAWKKCKGGCPSASQKTNNLGDSRCPVVQLSLK